MSGPIFISTREGLVNLSWVRRIVRKAIDGGNREAFLLYDETGCIGQTTTDPGEQIVSMIAPEQPFEIVGIYHSSDGEDEKIYTSPIVAWGLLADGSLTPLCMDLCVPVEPWGIRKIGFPEVEVPYVATYQTADHWLADRSKQREAADRKAAP